MNSAERFVLLLAPLLSLGCSGPSLDLRRETGQLGEAEFLGSAWRSENIRNTPADSLFVFRVLLTDPDLPDGHPEKVRREETASLEAELSELRRFPVVPSALGSSGSSIVAQLFDLGEIALPKTASVLRGVFVLEYACKRRYQERSPTNFPPLLTVSGKMHEYWYEGNASIAMGEVGEDGVVVLRPPIWATPNLRSRSTWKFEKTKLNGDHVEGHDHEEPSERDACYRECLSSVLFRISKEVYSKIGVESSIQAVKRSGKDVLLSINEGSDRGILPGQPMYIMWESNGLQAYMAKAVVDTTSESRSTLRVISWNRDDDDAQEMARDPSGYFLNRVMTSPSRGPKLLARTEGLAEPPSWQERRRRYDRMEASLEGDWSWAKMLDSRQRAMIRDLLESH